MHLKKCKGKTVLSSAFIGPYAQDLLRLVKSKTNQRTCQITFLDLT